MPQKASIPNKSLAIRLTNQVIQVSHITDFFVRFRHIYYEELLPRRWSKAKIYRNKKGQPYFHVYGEGDVYLNELVPLSDVCFESCCESD